MRKEEKRGTVPFGITLERLLLPVTDSAIFFLSLCENLSFVAITDNMKKIISRSMVLIPEKRIIKIPKIIAVAEDFRSSHLAKYAIIPKIKVIIIPANCS